MSGSITIGIGQSHTITQSGTYSPVTFDGVGTLAASGTNVFATIADISAGLANTFVAENGATLDFTTFLGISALDAYDINNLGTIELGSGLNVGLLSPITFDNTGGTVARLIVDPGLSVSLLNSIDGWKAGDSIQLDEQVITGVSWAQNEGLFGPLAGGVLTITTSTNGTESLTFGNGTYNNHNFYVSNGDDITFACFAAGTRIDTPKGPVAVETLNEGDLVCVASGASRAVKWIGFRRLDLTRYADKRMAHPVRILAGAFGDGMPRCDLLVSPDHALAIDGLLIPARMLVNNMTVRQECERTAITYYHVELETHDILLAEGLPTESYLDTGNRNIFENSAVPVALHPTFEDVDEQTRRHLGSCLPFAVDEVRVGPVWKKIAGRATELGHTPLTAGATTTDPDMVLLIGNRQVQPMSRDGNRYVFIVPLNASGMARLVSRQMVPADRQPWVDDRRRLGVMVRQFVLRTDSDERTIPVDHPLLDDGWWQVEGSDQSPGRWTNGSAVLPPLPGRSILTVELAGFAPSYPLETADKPRQLTAA